jgi:hypothetical protein
MKQQATLKVKILAINDLLMAQIATIHCIGA